MNPSHPLPEELAAALEGARDRLGIFEGRVRYFPTVGSTNDVAMAMAASAGAEGIVVIADRQTSGRGRLGRSWYSPPAGGLYVSVVLTPARARTDPGRATTLLTLTAGVALAGAVEAVCGLRADVKWPNDLYVGRRKLGGILAEAADPHVVVGYGINTSPGAYAGAYPVELADRATSIESELGRPVDRAELFAETLAALSRCYVQLLDGEFDAILDAWRRRAPASIGARVGWTTSSGPQSGVTMWIDDLGALLVRTEERVERIVAGELSWSYAASD